MDILKKLRVEFPERPIKVVWDGAPYHRAQLVTAAAATFDVDLEPLPGYSPDFMPVEHLWHWLREDVTLPRLLRQEGRLDCPSRALSTAAQCQPLGRSRPLVGDHSPDSAGGKTTSLNLDEVFAF